MTKETYKEFGSAEPEDDIALTYHAETQANNNSDEHLFEEQSLSTPNNNNTEAAAKPFADVFSDSVGWLSFSVVFNILNTIVYSALYPKILEEVVEDKSSYSTVFSVINLITTLASAVTLPLLGSLVDALKMLKPCLLISQYLGIIITLGLFVLDLLPQSVSVLHLYLNQLLYVFAMFFLRIAVMNNNAMLSTFSKKNITILSLLGNFIGFSVNMVGLLVVAFAPDIFPLRQAGISRECWWLLCFTGISLSVSILTFFSPSSKYEPVSSVPSEPKESKLKVFRTALVTALTNFADTFRNGIKNSQYRDCWLFLLGYLFFSASGTVVTIFLGPLFIAIYKLPLAEEVALNFYYKVAMVFGIIAGMIFERVNARLKINDMLHLMFQNTIFLVLLILMFVGVSLKLNYYAVLVVVLGIGFMYSWNISISRGCFSKLIPQGKSCEFMGLYSTLTYLGISLVSGVNALISKIGLPPQTLCLILIVWILPAYIFLVILFRIKRKEASSTRDDAPSESVEEAEKAAIIGSNSETKYT